MWTPETLPWLAALLALGLLLLAEMVLRRQSLARTRRELSRLYEAARRDRERLEELEADLMALRKAVGVAAPRAAGENRMIKGLVARLRGGRAAAQTSSAAIEDEFELLPQEDPAEPPLPFQAETAAEEGPDEEAILLAVREALSHDFVELVLQPVVSLPQRRRRFFECSTRIRDSGERVISDRDYLPVAERAGLVAAIDNILLFRCIQLVRTLGRRHEQVDFFCNVSAASLRDEHFFADFIDYLAQQPEPAAHLIFEFSHASFDAQGPRARALLERLCALGCRLSVDDAELERLDARALAARGVSFVKFDAARLLAFAEREGPAAAAELVSRTGEVGLSVVVENVRDEESLRELLDFGMDYGQGELFGEPRPARRTT